MKRVALLSGILVLVAGWALAAAHAGITGHMAAHMLTVAVAAPLIAIGLRGGPLDPAVLWPRIVAPLPMSVLEMLVVWGWHMPAARALAASGVAGLALEQGMFLVAGLLLWSACLGAGDADSMARRAGGILALLLTTMHMTLLGVLIALAPRTLYGTTGSSLFGTELMPLHDQQVGGVIMLLVGGGSYLLGGLALLRRLVHGDIREPAPR
jgi:putative membrane protein